MVLVVRVREAWEQIPRLPLTGCVVLGKGMVKNLLGQSTEQMNGILGNPRAGGSILPQEIRTGEAETNSHIILASFGTLTFFFSFLEADFPSAYVIGRIMSPTPKMSTP